MPVEVITGLISSIIGGLLVAVVNHFLTRKKTQAEVEKLKAEADKMKMEADKVRIEIEKLNSAVEETSSLLATTAEEIIYDGTEITGIEDYDIEGQIDIIHNILVMKAREFHEFRLRRYLYSGKYTDFLPKNEGLAKRMLRVGFETKATQGEGFFIICFETLEHESLEVITSRIDHTEWKKINRYIQLPSDKDCLLTVLLESLPPGSFQLRNLVLAERVG